MKFADWRKRWPFGVAIVAVTGLLLVLVMSQRAATIAAAAQTAAPRVAGKPDFSGIWQANNTANWDLHTHEARRMIAQPGLLPNCLVLASPVVGLCSIGCVADGLCVDEG